MIKKFNKIGLKCLLKGIRLYQRTLSPDHGYMSFRYPYGYCRFHPSCSEYTHQSLEKHGILKGTFLSIKRILKCNPFHQGGEDPVK